MVRVGEGVARTAVTGLAVNGADVGVELAGEDITATPAGVASGTTDVIFLKIAIARNSATRTRTPAAGRAQSHQLRLRDVAGAFEWGAGTDGESTGDV